MTGSGTGTMTRVGTAIGHALSQGWGILTALLATGYMIIGSISPAPSIRWTALAGAILVLAALWLARRSRRAALVALFLGAAFPLAAAWWSLVVPLTALLMLICGTLAVRSTASA
jgi:hypothetical protein